MSTLRLRLSQLVFMVSICILVFTSCNSSKQTACTSFQDSRNYSKSTRKPYETKTYIKKRQQSPINVNQMKIIYVNQDNKRAKNSEIISKDKTDFTFIILREQNQFFKNGKISYLAKFKSIPPPEVVTYNQHKRIKKIQKEF